MRKKVDLTGKVYGRLTVISESHTESGSNRRWLCKCECGNETIVFGQNIKRGLTTSCGCYSKESHTKHGLSTKSLRTKNDEYSSWQHMKDRCINSKSEGYKDYGAIGITICDRWLGEHGFENFFLDMGPKPNNEYTLDRFPDKKGNYGPDNCRWATEHEQKRNLIRNIWITHEGRTMVAADWAKEFNIPHWRIRHFTLQGLSFGQIIEKHEKAVKKNATTN
jgi:hypothetical protein